MSGRLVAALTACLLLASVPLASASPRLVVFGIRQDPADANARDFSRPGYGGGVEFSWPLANTQQFLAVHGGLEAVNLLSGKKVFYDPQTLLRIEQHTDQTYGRFFLGGQMGPHGGGTLRPYVNADLALV